MPFESTVGESDLVIGQEYFGSIVTKVKQEVEDKPEDGKLTIKRYVTLKTGVILVEEYRRERGSGKVENKEYGGKPGQFEDEPKDDTALREKARAMIAKNKDKKPDKKKKKKKKKKAEPKEVSDSEPGFDLDHIYDVPARVLPASKLPIILDEDEPVTGSWMHNDGTDDSDWEPMDVTITKDPPSFLEPGEPHGVVALKRGAQPNMDGKVDPSDLKFLAPGETPPKGYKEVGHWTPGKLNQQWPPVKPEPESNGRKTRKPKLPDLDGELCKVVPYSRVPDTQEDGAPLTGVWKQPDGYDDTDWEPMFVEITGDPPSDLSPGEPNGIVAAQKGAEPDEYGDLDPADLEFFTPGEDPPDNYEELGYWRPNQSGQWPPKKPKPRHNLREAKKLTLPNFDDVPATVVPKKKLPEARAGHPDEDDNAPLLGAWKHNDGTDDEDWDPMDVVITEEPPPFLELGEPSGIVAVKDGAEPNKVGKLDPSDLAFFTPGEDPPSNYNKVGHWRPGKLNQDWPPGKPALPDFQGPARVVPKSKAPYRQNDAPTTGVWKHSDDTDDSDWDPMDVDISEDPPSDLEPGEPSGIVAVEDGVKPDKTGKLKPSDLKFIPPNEKLPRGFNKVGHWRPGKLDQDWPPKKALKLTGPAKVVPKSKAPYRQNDDDPTTGVWKHSDGADDSDWDPMDVDITEDPPSDLEPGEPSGIVAVEDGIKPDSVGKLKPSDLKFIPPNEKLPQGFNKVGHWRPGKLNQDWPPKKALKLMGPARVVPKSKAPYLQTDDVPTTGVWKHNDGTDDADWDPMDVNITEDPPSDLEPGEPNGIAAVEDGIKPDSVGKLKPSDLKFFTPDEKPPHGFNKVGHWRPSKLNQDWPPKSSVPDFEGPATIVPESKAPKKQGMYSPPVGVWRHNNDTDDSSWDPMDVVITNDPPSDLEPDDPHGIVALEDGVKPDRDGKVDPSDLKFLPPDERPPRGFKQVGHWQPGKLNQKWPPKPPSLDFDGPARVVPKSKAPYRQGADAPTTGVWKHDDGTDDSDWDPMDVIITKEPPSFLEPGEPHGVVAVEDGVKTDNTGKLKPSDLKFFTPEKNPPPGFNKVGHWRPGKLNQDWPPKKAALNLEGPAKVMPKIRAPRKQGKHSPPTGVWKHNDDTDDSDWDSMDVIISKDPPSDLKPGEPSGIVAVDEEAKIDKDGKVDPPDLKFFAPGEEPSPLYNKVGHWRSGKLNQDWPPKKPKPTLPCFDGHFAKVVPKAKVHERSIKDPPLKGVWQHNDDTEDSDWDPIGVYITKDPPSDLDEGEFSGIVAVEEGVKPDSVGKLDPSDLKFFTPGEEPPSNYNKLGHWRPAKKSGWPPGDPSPETKNARSVGKLKIPGFDRIPETGVIYPRSRAPESHDEGKEQIIAKGVWKWSKPENKPEEAESWMPSKVDLYENGNEPHDWDDTQSNGVFGVNPNLDPEEKPKPTDLWFYPPDEKPDEGFEPIGKWRPKKLEWSFPPKSVGKVEDKREFKEFKRAEKNVGKLKIPSIFK